MLVLQVYTTQGDHNLDSTSHSYHGSMTILAMYTAKGNDQE
jgi:hypothetical protein